MAIQAAALKVVVGAETSGAERDLNTFSSRLENTAQRAGAAGRRMSVGFTAPILALGAAVGAVGIDFESAFAGVIKTVDATDEQLATLRSGILAMSQEIPVAASDLAGIAEAAGQLGIETENILGFTRTMADLGVATNLTGEQAATALARFANITGMPQDQFDRLGSTIVALGNNLATTESEIVDFALRLAGAGKQIGLSEAQILSFGAALSSVGISAEAGGTAFSRVMIDMANAVATGNENLERFAEVAGMSSAQFKTAFEQDAAGAIIAFITGLGEMSAAGENVFPVLEELGLSEIRVRDALLRASGASDLFTEAMQIGSQAWAENTALATEAEQRYATTASMLTTLANNVRLLGISLFDHMQPGLQANIQSVTNFAKGLADAAIQLGQTNPQLVNAGLAFAGVLAAAGPALLAISGVASALGLLLSPLGAVTVGVATLAAAWIADFGGMRSATMNAIESMRPGFQTLLGWLDQARQGDFSGLQSGLQMAIDRVNATIEDFSWSDFVTDLGDWSQYIVSLEWTSYIPDLAWDIYLESLSWPQFVQELAWDTYIASLRWSRYVQSLTWESLVEDLSDWGAYVAELHWDAFVTTLDWSVYVGRLAWSTYVPEIDWSAYIPKLTWTGVFVTAVDWATYIPALAWSNYLRALNWGLYVLPVLWNRWISVLDWSLSVVPLVWGNFVGALRWLDYVNNLNWGAFIVGVLTWRDHVGNLVWAEYVTTLGDWIRFVPRLAWSSFVEKVEWPSALTDFSWEDYISRFNWPESLSEFSWSDWAESLDWVNYLQEVTWSEFIDDLSWRAWVTGLSWSDFVPTLSWSEFVTKLSSWSSFVPDIDWSRFIPRLNWSGLGNVPTGAGVSTAPVSGGAPVFTQDVNAGVDTTLGGNALGTSFWRGGWSVVGERGREIVNLPRGSRIFSNSETEALLAGAGGATININNPTIANDIDVELLARRIQELIRRRRA